MGGKGSGGSNGNSKFKPKRGRPEKPIDWNFVEQAMIAGSNQKRIAEAVGVDQGTFIDKFRKQYDEDFTIIASQKRQYGESLLELSQFQKALNNSSKGNPQMLMYLGKVKLGQVEAEPIKVQAPNQEEINYVDLLARMQHENVQLKIELENVKRLSCGDEQQTS